MKKLYTILFLIVTVTAAFAGNMGVANPPGPKWLKTAVFYEIYPLTFQDSDGDGVGDLILKCPKK